MTHTFYGCVTFLSTTWHRGNFETTVEEDCSGDSGKIICSSSLVLLVLWLLYTNLRTIDCKYNSSIYWFFLAFFFA